uniref:(northern house mosquito) hypothetical protein n=1 Tax=Culex pipiens TaxID=7175 RepID=A0A8D8JCB4_CULPI
MNRSARIGPSYFRTSPWSRTKSTPAQLSTRNRTARVATACPAKSGSRNRSAMSPLGDRSAGRWSGSQKTSRTSASSDSTTTRPCRNGPPAGVRVKSTTASWRNAPENSSRSSPGQTLARIGP